MYRMLKQLRSSEEWDQLREVEETKEGKESLNAWGQNVLTHEKKGRRYDDKYCQKDDSRLGVS